MNLYLVHCGFYDAELFDGIYENHVNLLVAARDFDEARTFAKENEQFKGKKMHVDGIQEIQVVNGWKVGLSRDPEFEGQTILVSRRHRDLAPKPANPTGT